MIKVKNLTYTYAGASAETLHGLEFEVAEKEIFGFLGPSGAGKSTTQKILIGLLKNYGGSIQIMGREVSEWGQSLYEQVGVSFELPNHYLKLTGRENLSYFQSLYNGETHDPMTVLQWVGLADDADKSVSDYSKGMKIRLNVARSLLHKPKLLFLDEPTSGLDPVNARKVKELVLSLRDSGTTVFVTTHDMMVADELCDRVAFVTNGEINEIDAPSVLKKRYGKRGVQVRYAVGDSAEIHSQAFPLDNLGRNADFLNLLNSGKHIETIHSQESTLENIFIEVTGQELST
ncbi:MAG: ATP-binding cassette domain-containing protein [Candidatus Promineifilaceae bacterium]